MTDKMVQQSPPPPASRGCPCSALAPPIVQLMIFIYFALPHFIAAVEQVVSRSTAASSVDNVWPLLGNVLLLGKLFPADRDEHEVSKLFPATATLLAPALLQAW